MGLAQFNPVVGGIAQNSERIRELYTMANNAGCDIVAFPELSITGYPPEDLVLKSGFVAENQQAMREIIAATGECVAVFGFVSGSHGDLRNSAAIASRGLLHGTYDKHLLPNYSVFDEERYFTPGSAFSLFTIAGVHVGVTICEDIWQSEGPVKAQAQAGAAMNININGSPFHRGKFDERQQMVSERAKDNSCAIVYVNQVCGQDELVFDGGSMVFDHHGDLVMRAPQFEEKLTFVDLEVNESLSTRGVPVIEVSAESRARGEEQRGLISSPNADLEQVFGALVLGTRDYVRKNGFTDVVIGLSG
ncbi:MAG: NAD+ synthase, partial [Actinobacteria bacterium]|nr:NAD+ synthase [Actinomycetota bacterium]